MCLISVVWFAIYTSTRMSLVPRYSPTSCVSCAELSIVTLSFVCSVVWGGSSFFLQLTWLVKMLITYKGFCERLLQKMILKMQIITIWMFIYLQFTAVWLSIRQYPINFSYFVHTNFVCKTKFHISIGRIQLIHLKFHVAKNHFKTTFIFEAFICQQLLHPKSRPVKI